MKKVEKTDWSTMLIALSDNFSFENRGTINRMTLPEILKAIQEKIGFDPEDRSVLNNADKEELPCDVGNEWDELVLDDLNPEDRAEFREMKEAIETKRMELYKNEWDIIRKSLTKKRKRGRPKRENDTEKKFMKGNTKVKVKTKWIRKLRRNSTRPPLHDEEQAQKRQRTSSPLSKPEDAFKQVEEVLLDSEETKETSLPPNGVANETGPFDFEASGVAMQGETTHEGDSSNQGESSNLREVEAIHHQEETTLMVVPSAAPASPAVSQVSMTSRQTHGQRTRGESLAWQSVFCSGCNFEYGQYKFDPSPGGRDAPTWDYRVLDERGAVFVFFLEEVKTNL